MEEEHRQVLSSLLTRERVLSLSVLIDERPYVGMLPFAVWPQAESLLVHASGLARHTKGLEPGAPYAALIHESDRPGADPRQLPRVSVEGEVRRLERDEPDYAATREIYQGRFPSSAMTFQLGDFNLYALRIDRGRFFRGFASTFNLSPGILSRLDLV